MILDNEQQRQELLSLLSLVPIQGNLNQGVDKIIQSIMALIETIKNADVKLS